MGSGYEIARALQRCIGAGHSPELAWTYTPRQLIAWGEIIDRDQLAKDNKLFKLMSHASNPGKSTAKFAKTMDEQSQ